MIDASKKERWGTVIFQEGRIGMKVSVPEQVGSTIDIKDRMPSQQCISALPEMSVSI